MERRERHIKVANGVRADVEADGDLPLDLADGFTLILRDVLYVPSLQMNLISVSCLDKDGYDCHFGNDKCKITFNNACVGCAILQNELYLLSLRDEVNVVCDDGNVACDNENVSSSAYVNKKIKENSRCIVEIKALSFRPYFEGENRKTS
jgi:hypothetical protein